MTPFRTATAALMLFLLPGGAGAADQLVTGKRLSMADRAGRQRLAFMSKDSIIVAPTPQGSSDPTATGASFRVVVPATGEASFFDLPAANWSKTANGVRYKFRNTAAPGGPSQVKIAMLQNGKINVSARSTGITLNEIAQPTIGIVLTAGATRYCALFGGQVIRNEPGSFSAKNAPAPASCPGDQPGTSTDVILASDVDGEDIAFTVHQPTLFSLGAKYPLILEGHGYGGNRITAAERPASGGSGLIARLLDAGYGVISVDQRGHGDSGGKIRILDPNFEGKDLIQMLDWAEDNLGWLAYRNSNLLLGATGGSYGGGYQHTIYSHDPEKRLDALAPEITWHDLNFALFPNHVFKSVWAILLSAAGNATPGGQDQEVNDGLTMGLTQNDLTQTQQDLLKAVSLAQGCDDATLTPIDALYWQSTSDTLFSLNEAVHNYQCVSALGGDVRLLTKNSGHDSILGGSTGEQCGDLDKVQSIVDWYDEKLKGMAGKASYIPDFCFHMDGSTNDGVVTATLPIGGDNFSVPSTSVIALEGSVLVQSMPLTTIGAGGAILAGVPTIQVNVTDPLAQNLGDPILFIGIGKQPAGSPTVTLIPSNQVRPFRGYGSFDDELLGVTARLAVGDQLRLLIYASFTPRYVGSGTDVAAPVDVDAMVQLPLHPANLPAPPAN